MAIYGIEGGIGTGKTLTGVWFLLDDLMSRKKTIYTNVRLKNVPKEHKGRVNYLTKELIGDIYENIKSGKFKMKNSTVFIQEAHNYIDSRNSMSAKNRAITYWILQSRHMGQGSSDIIYDTQDFIQVDKRLRQNTDFYMRPLIIARDHKNRPIKIRLDCWAKIQHKIKKFNQEIDTSGVINMYDTHELVDF